MKKLFGLLVIGAVGTFIACSSDDSDSNPYSATGNGNQTFCPAGTVSSLDAAGNTFCSPIGSSSSDAAVAPTSAADPASSNGGFVPTSAADPASSATPASSADVLPAVSSSSVATPVAASSSSAPAVTPASSSAPATPASSAVKEVEVDDGLFTLGLWDGTAGAGQVPTGNKKGGYWYSYTDDASGGESAFTWCSEAGSSYDANDLAPVIKENGGICGSVELIVGTNEYTPYAALEFGYGAKSSEFADASASKGVCISYQSDIPMKLYLGQSKDQGGQEPYVDLPAGTKTLDFAWSEFEPPEWATKGMTGPEAAKTLAKIGIKFQGDTDGEDGEGGSFLIKKLGAAGQCE